MEGIIAKREFLNCLPTSLRSNSIDFNWLTTARVKLSTRPLSEFCKLSDGFPLSEFIAVAGSELNRLKNAFLLLLFDRADMVPAPCLSPVFELLDQSGDYILLLAMRPSLVHIPIQCP